MNCILFIFIIIFFTLPKDYLLTTVVTTANSINSNNNNNQQPSLVQNSNTINSVAGATNSDLGKYLYIHVSFKIALKIFVRLLELKIISVFVIPIIEDEKVY